jgi:hypothetical protein
MASVTVVATVAILGIACEDQQSVQPKPETKVLGTQPSYQERRRFEIHDVVNGTFHGTILLDTFTGKCWIFGSNMKNGSVTDTGFNALGVYPEPVLNDDKNDPLGIR